MDNTSRQQSERGVKWAQASRDELIDRLMWAVREDGLVEPLDGLHLWRISSPTQLRHSVSFPCLCVLAQGGQEILLGSNRYEYDPAQYLIITAALPIASRVTAASKEKPYLKFLLRLDPSLVGSVLVEVGQITPCNPSTETAIDVSELDTGLLDAVVRLTRLLDAPSEARYLTPLLKREIVYRLLLGAQGNRLHYIAALGGSTPAHRIAEAIMRLRKDFDQPLRIEDMARELGMSVSGFYHHFRSVTAMSPLQFLKQLRLQEARRLMLSEGLDAASAAYRVGYHDASHFNREYKGLFGLPPLRDVERLREAARENVVTG